MTGKNGGKADRVAERRARVMDAARQLFVMRGFHAASTAQIAEVAGIAVQQMYRDFGSKEGIVCAIVEEDIVSLFEAIDSTVAGRSREGLHHWLYDVIMRSVEPEEGDLRSEILAEGRRNEQIAKLITEVEDRIRAAVLTIISTYSPPGRSQAELTLLTEIVTGLITTDGSHLRASSKVPAHDIAMRLTMMLEREIIGVP